MRKNLFKLFASVSIFASLFAVNVQALGVEEGNNSASESVTVGNVQTPVYSVDISWGDFAYDWVYESSTGEYRWEPSDVESCVRALPSVYDENAYTAAINEGNIYSDSSCSASTNSVAYADIESTTVFTKVTAPGASNINISDASTAGQIVPSVSWTPSTGYDWVTGKFNYSDCSFECVSIDDEESFNTAYEIYTDNACSTFVDKSTLSYQANTYYTKAGGCVYNSITGGEVPEEAVNGMGVNENGTAVRAYTLDFEIGVDSSKTITTPKAGDTVGTITVSIAAKE